MSHELEYGEKKGAVPWHYWNRQFIMQESTTSTLSKRKDVTSSLVFSLLNVLLLLKSCKLSAMDPSLASGATQLRYLLSRYLNADTFYLEALGQEGRRSDPLGPELC